MNKRIEIVVDPKGNSTVETKGFTGSQCMAASEFIEQALGKRVVERKTQEFFARASSSAQQNSGWVELTQSKFRK